MPEKISSLPQISIKILIGLIYLFFLLIIKLSFWICNTVPYFLTFSVNILLYLIIKILCGRISISLSKKIIFLTVFVLKY